MQRVRVSIRIDRDRLDPELPARTYDADGNLAAVGDQDSFEGKHVYPSYYIRNTPNLDGGMGALNAAEIPSANASRVRAGSRMPSSHSRAVE